MGTLLTLATKFTADTAGYVSDVTKAKGITDAFKGTLETVAKVAAGAVVAGFGAVVGVTTQAMGAVQEWGGTLDDIQDILGGTNKQAAGLAVMMERVGGDADQITKAIQKMAMGLNKVNKDGISKTETSLGKLNIQLKKSNGQMKDSYEIFGEVADIVSKMPDGLEKDAILMDLFGKSGAELGDALNAAADGGMSRFQEEADKMNLVIDPSGVIEYEKAHKRLDQTLNGLWVTIGNALLPSATSLMNTLTALAQRSEVQDFVKNLAETAGRVADAFLKGVEAGGLFQGVLDGMRAAGLTEVANTLLDIRQKFEEVKTYIETVLVPVLSGLIGNILKGDWDTVKAQFTVWFTGLEKDINKWEMSPSFVEFATKLGENIGAGIYQGIYDTLSAKKNSLGQSIYDFIKSADTKLKEAVIELIASFVSGFVGGFLEKMGVDSEFRYKIQDGLKNTMRTVVGFVFNDLLGFLLNPMSAVVWAFRNWVAQIQRMLDSLHLPSWLTPGSPTPLEMGIRGINAAMKDSVSQILPQFSAQIAMGNAPAATTQAAATQQSEFSYEELARSLAYAMRDTFRLAQAEGA